MKTSPKSREGEVRCLNCFARFRPAKGADRATCPDCGIGWRLSYPSPNAPKIRGPVWDTYPKPE